jgi:murein tripeptide amidase MpaA
VTIGGNMFSAAQVRHLVDPKDIYVFPQANPDGRRYGMTKVWYPEHRVTA